MNWTNILSKALKPRDNRGRVLFWVCVVATIMGLLGIHQPLENLLRDFRNGTHRQAVSGQIAVVAIDNRSLDKVGSFPWSRRRHAELVRQLDKMGARRIHFDIVFADRSDPKADATLAAALEPLGRRVVLPAMISMNSIWGDQTETYPLPELGTHTAVANLSVQYDIFGAIRRIPYSMEFSKGSIGALSTEIAGIPVRSGSFPVDFSLDPRTIPMVSAADVLDGTADPAKVAGKDVVIGVTYQPYDDAFLAPGYGVIPGVFFHVLAAETLKKGTPTEYSWAATFVPAILIVLICGIVRRKIFTISIFSIAFLACFGVPFYLERNLVFIEVLPPLMLLTFSGTGLAWLEARRSYRLRGTTNAISGLPNLVAFQQQSDKQNQVIVAARVHNFAAVTSTLAPDAESGLVQQIAKRLTVGAINPELYQGDEGIFSWFADAGPPSAIGSHLEALHTLFRSPVIVEGQPFDLKLSFGFDAEPGRSISNRFASALVAADEAVSESRKWKQYDPTKLKDAAWKLSLLSQLDAAIDAGDIWVAYQPKLDIRTGSIVGAEALARWTHPDKGPISPIEFIIAAEENNRIERLTHFVLERAIQAAAAINQHGISFGIAVNLSGTMIDDPDLCRIVQMLLTKHALPANMLTLEVTETAALSSADRHLNTLADLRKIGVKISVDDYGTGMSTLDYLQRIPATEIKVDRSFILGMGENQATRVMVNSTIQLAHSLEQQVVAEGVEDEDTLDQLRRMGCDLAQGYHIGRPMTFRALSKRVLEERRTEVA